MSAQSVVYRRESTYTALILQLSKDASPQRCFQWDYIPTFRGSGAIISTSCIRKTSLPDKTLRYPRIFIPRTLTDITPVLLIEHVKVRPVRANIRIRPNRQRGGSERAASHGRVHAVGSAVDDCAPGSDAGGPGG